MSPPPRAKHLWRYTPWPRIKPQEGVPVADKILFSLDGDVTLQSGAPRAVLESDIARVFLSEIGGSSHTLHIDGDFGLIHIQAKASGHVAAGHLHIDCKGSATVILHLTGEADWSGLYVSGEVADNCKLAYGFVNELSNDCKLLHCEDWSVGRDAAMEIAALSVGGFRCKSDVRTALIGSGGSLKQAVTVHGFGSRHIDNHIEINHKVANCNSKLVINSACAGSSRSIATGLLKVAEGANGTDAGKGCPWCCKFTCKS
jgi:Fe-S cluster assembly scaffold protein SufB